MRWIQDVLSSAISTKPLMKSLYLLRRFSRDSIGSTAVMFALATPVLFSTIAGVVDFAEASSAKATLQSIVDSVALSAAGQLRLDKSSATMDRAQAKADGEAKVLYPRWTVTTAVTSDTLAGSVTVSQLAKRPSLFSTFMPPWTIGATATATQLSSKPLCVLTLQNTGTSTLGLQTTSRMDALACQVQSNADIIVQSGASLSAGRVQSVGAASGSISPTPITDAPTLPDPFASMSINVPSYCNDTGGVHVSGHGTQTLNPGVHCGDFTVSGSATLLLNPGEHYFVGGVVELKGQGQLVGSDVVMIFKNNASISFGGNTAMSLEGRKSGPYAGFVIVTDRSQTGTFSISTDSARLLHGTIYLPQATLGVSGSASKVADHSPWTVVVAKQIGLSGSPDLVLNANYNLSTVPTPAGVGPNGALRLVQ